MRIHKNEAVVLLHGLGLHSLFMNRIQKSLYDNGYDVFNIDYPSRRHNIETLTAHVYHLLQDKKIGAYRRVHFIGHSLGGVLIRNLLYRYLYHNQGKVIVLAPPNKGSIVVDILKKYLPIRWCFGPAFLELGTDSIFLEQLKYIPNDYYVIAGNSSKRTFFSFMFSEVNDGAVSLESTIAEGMERTHHAVFPVTHFTVLYNEKVIRHILEVLK